ELFALHRTVKPSRSPVHFEDLLRTFDYPVPEKPSYPDEPQRPTMLAIPADMPELRLPYFFANTKGLPLWKPFNRIVDASNQLAWQQMRSRTADAIGEIEARNASNLAREHAYDRARERYVAAVHWVDGTWQAALAENAKAEAQYRRLVETYLAKLRAL